MAEQIYKVRDPSGNIREIKGPEGASDEEVIAQAKTLFGSTPGGAAVGNPQMQAQARNLRPDAVSVGERLSTIGGAGVAGGILGAASPEILTGLGAAAASFPVTAPAAPFLTGAGSLLRGGRGAAATMGAVGGLVGETAGQTVEAAGGSQLAAEGARLVGGAAGGETLNLAKIALQKYIVTPSLSLISKMQKETAKSILDKMDGIPQTLTEAEQKFVNEQIASLRGGAKTNEPLERVGSIMGNEADRLLTESDRQMRDAVIQAGQVGKPGAFGGKQRADIGEELRDTITTRNKASIEARQKQFDETKRIRDLNVAYHEKAGNLIDRSPEYQELVSHIQNQIRGPKNSPSIKASYQKVLDELYNPNETGKTSFNAIDQTRRQLGDVFRGKPAQGYEAIDANVAKDLYGRISDMQKKYAGPAQVKLLDDYHAATEGLEIFSSKAGKKATALDQFVEGNYATDASTLPSSYFKTRASVQSLKALTGSNTLVNRSALEFADKELSGLSAPEARSWMTKNAEWLGEVGPAHRVIAKYVDRLESAERSMTNAQAFAKQAAADSSLLTRQSLPAQRAADLIKSGDTELWAKVIPAVQQSPQAKTQLVSAVRQVVADQATSKATGDLFSRNIRPFLEQSKIATKAEMDFIASKLDDIQAMNIPEPERLGMAKRLLLQSTGTWAASAASRGAVGGYNYMANQVPTEQTGLRP